MARAELKKNEKKWCWWMHRYLFFCKKDGDTYIFIDIDDEKFLLSESQVSKLTDTTEN